MYFQIFFGKTDCPKPIEATTVKKVPNERKLIYAIYNYILTSWCLLFSYASHWNTTSKNGIFGDVNLAPNRNSNILKCMFTLNGTYMNYNYFNILLYIAIYIWLPSS